MRIMFFVVLVTTLIFAQNTLSQKRLTTLSESYIKSFKVKYQDKYENKFEALNLEDKNLLLILYEDGMTKYLQDVNKETMHDFVKNLYKFVYSSSINDGRAVKMAKKMESISQLKGTPFVKSLISFGKNNMNKLEQDIKEWDKLLKKLNMISPQSK